MSNPGLSCENKNASGFIPDILNSKIGRGLAVALAGAALLGFAGKAKANDGGYPWANALCEFGAAGGSSCANPNNRSDKYDWGVYDSSGAFHPYRNGYEYRNCTDYAQWKESQYGISVPSNWGNGSNWDNAAAAAGDTVTSVPEAGDIAQWDGKNHVAVVESVNPDGSANISEYNWNANGTFDTRNNVRADHYIDLNGVGVGVNGGGGGEITTNVMDRPLGVAAHPSGEQDVFYRDSAGNLREYWWGNDRRWHGPISLGMEPMGSAPTAVVRPSNDEQDVFWKGKDNNIWRAYYDGGWHGPQLIAHGSFASEPAASAYGSEVEVFAKGSNGDLWETWQSYPGGHWNGPIDLGMGPLGSAPTAAAHSDGEQDVFWRGTDGGLWEGYYTPWNGHWIGPINLGMGQLGTAPTAIWEPGKNEQDVFWMGGDSNLWQTVWDGQKWANPMFIGHGPLGSAPTAAAWKNEIDIFWRGMDNGLWETAGNTFQFYPLFRIGDGPIGVTYP